MYVCVYECTCTRVYMSAVSGSPGQGERWEVENSKKGAENGEGGGG